MFRRLFRILGAPAAAFLGVALIAACAGPAPDEDVLVLRNFTLIDGTGAGARPDSAMVIRGGRIEWVGPDSGLDAPRGAETVDLDGGYVTPGLIDLHVHLGIVDLRENPENYSRGSLEAELATYAAYGVTTVLSMGADHDLVLAYRNEQRGTRPQTARVFSAGQGVVLQGGYGGAPGVTTPVATPEDAVRVVAEQADKGADIIKIWVDDELGTMPAMPPEISQAVIDAAHERGLRVVAHIFYLEDARRLVEQGVDGLAHSVRDQLVDQAFIDAMRSRGVWQFAETLSREASMFIYGEGAPFLDDPFFARAASPEIRARLGSEEYRDSVVGGPHYHDYSRFFETAQANVIRLAEGGVSYAFGTDSGPPWRFPGYFAHWELELLVEAGLTPGQALATATGRAAAFLGAEDLGTLEPSKWADLIVLDADPLQDIRNTRTIRAVYVAGRRVPAVND